MHWADALKMIQAAGNEGAGLAFVQAGEGCQGGGAEPGTSPDAPSSREAGKAVRQGEGWLRRVVRQGIMRKEGSGGFEGNGGSAVLQEGCTVCKAKATLDGLGDSLR